jgi:hypothetical protein
VRAAAVAAWPRPFALPFPVRTAVVVDESEVTDVPARLRVASPLVLGTDDVGIDAAARVGAVTAASTVEIVSARGRSTFTAVRRGPVVAVRAGEAAGRVAVAGAAAGALAVAGTGGAGGAVATSVRGGANGSTIASSAGGATALSVSTMALRQTTPRTSAAVATNAANRPLDSWFGAVGVAVSIGRRSPLISLGTTSALGREWHHPFV